MIYLDNAATGGRKPDAVLSAVRSAIVVSANPGRSGHKLSLALATQVLNCRKELSNFFSGYGYERVVFTKNCTEALNLALLGTLEEGDHVVVTCLEHNSVLRPLHHLNKTRGVSYSVCPLTNGEIDPEKLLSLITARTRAVVVTAASNVTGVLCPLREIGNKLPENVLFFCDGAQGAGHFPISMQDYKIDVLTLAGHKGLMGIQGSGALLFSPRVQPKPVLFGGTGTTSHLLEMPDFYPDCLEAGTLSYPAVISLLEGVRFLKGNMPKLASEVFNHTKALCSAMETLPDYICYSKPNPCGIVAFRHRTLPSEWVATELSEQYGIALRGGLHCAPLAHQALGSEEYGLLRASFSHFNTPAERNALFTALKSIARRYKG
ncbi:MAG: aminotransferase class V-fold PLP-dependent enzyme [Clostridia bacterium]|nr:aminotransferase class V-fold PLP-dependent enzyme [Clostridia bacterium]